MSTRPERIPIPWPQRWERLRERVIPIICFILTIFACGWLWRYQSVMAPVATGEVHVEAVNVRAPIAGTLVDLGNAKGADSPLLVQVEQGAVCARLQEEGSEEVVEIPAPIKGAITQTLAHPGQLVMKGDVLLTISSAESQYILCRLPEFVPTIPQPGDEVSIRTRVRGAKWYQSTVEAVGPAVESAPVIEGVNAIPERGSPVRIALPEGAGMKPGASVEVRFRPTAAKL